MWQDKNGSLERHFIFKDFEEAFDFMKKVATEAEQQHHHPKWLNDYNEVTIWLSTHEEGQVTEKDRRLASAIDAIAEPDSSETVSNESNQLSHIKMYADGGSRGNPGPSASGYVLFSLEGKTILERGVYLGIATNNKAEYTALQLGLEEARKLGITEVDVYMDSLLVVNQMLGKFKIRNQELWVIHDAIKALVKDFRRVSFTHVPRELNKAADAMVNKALDAKLKV